MKKSLIDVIFASDKRKETLLLLKDGHQEMKSLLKSLDTTRQALLPQMKILEEHHLVFHYDDIYELTFIGELIVDKVRPLIDTTEVLDVDIDYWGTHDFDFVPPNLLERINELKHYKIINPPLMDLFNLHKTYHKDKTPEHVYSVGNIFYPNYQSRFTEMIDNKITINYIVSKDLFNKIRKESNEHIELLIKSGYFKLYVYHQKINFLFFTFDDYHIVMNPLKKAGDVDHSYIICSTEDALNWGKELFNYYLKDSTPITRL
ncbi:helix-turn-helix transcriptional regulator [Methanolobus halotolerans]|uniref:Transcriptional regulator n=1 Tax=Methanolobus halotolerans TaxID=2052935 RepID=A0A4E0PUZ8_9EURY|nr:winged helix-turn-helix domain-containing protein [Methanolobus halotolerans]TGC07426.1 transcriptional regulator [Methanolobus halotolerans]